MKVADAKIRLHDTSFFLGGFRRRAAFKALTAARDAASIEVLIDALTGAEPHPLQKRIDAYLTALSLPTDRAPIERIWELWSKSRSPVLDRLVSKARWPTARPDLVPLCALKAGRESELGSDVRTVRQTLGLLSDPDEVVRAAVLRYASALPSADSVNDEVFAAWLASESAELERLIADQDRKPTHAEMLGLFHLVTGQPARFLALGDEPDTLFGQAFAIAPEAFRARVNQTVLRSGDPRLVAAYQKAMSARTEFDPKLYTQALKTARDDDRLFEAARHLTLAGVLDLCEWWATRDSRPRDAIHRSVVEQALVAYRALGGVGASAPRTAPEGLVDIFEWWRQQSPTIEDLKRDLQAADPFERARGLYLGHERGIVDDERLRRAYASEDWPERLIARLLAPAMADPNHREHVQWIDEIFGVEGELLGARIDSTPEDYRRFSEMLKSLDGVAGPIATKARALLGILCLFQGSVVGGIIRLAETREATDPGAVQTKDAPLKD